MSSHDQKPSQPRAIPDQPSLLQEGYQPGPLYGRTRGYQPKAKDPGSPSKPPENPPNQGPVGRKR